MVLIRQQQTSLDRRIDKQENGKLPLFCSLQENKKQHASLGQVQFVLPGTEELSILEALLSKQRAGNPSTLAPPVKNGSVAEGGERVPSPNQTPICLWDNSKILEEEDMKFVILPSRRRDPFEAQNHVDILLPSCA